MKRKIVTVAVISALVSIATIAVTAEESPVPILNTKKAETLQPAVVNKVGLPDAYSDIPENTEIPLSTVAPRIIKGVWGFGNKREAVGKFYVEYSSHPIVGKLMNNDDKVIAHIIIKLYPERNSWEKQHTFSGRIHYTQKNGYAYTRAILIRGTYSISHGRVVGFWNIVYPAYTRLVSSSFAKMPMKGWFSGEII